MAQQENGRIVVPGDVVYDTRNDPSYVPGKGCYQLQGLIRASVMGYVHLKEKTENDKVVKYVEIFINHRDDDTLMPEKGNVVTAKVTEVGPLWANCELLFIEDRRMNKEFDCILPKTNIKEALFASEIDVLDCVQPGDIILARVIDYSFRHRAFVLSTAEDELGVVFAKGLTGYLRAVDFETVMDDATGTKEKRKVAKVPLHMCLAELTGKLAEADISSRMEE